MPKTAAEPQSETAIFAPQKRTHLYAVSTPKQRLKLYDEVDQRVNQLVGSDEDAYALAYLIDVVTGIYRSQLSLGGDRSSDLPEFERQQCAIRILTRAFTLSCSHTDAMIAWLGLEDAKPKQEAKPEKKKKKVKAA